MSERKKKFTVCVKIMLDLNVEVRALNLEDALAKARDDFKKANDLIEIDMSQVNYDEIEVTGVFT